MNVWRSVAFYTYHCKHMDFGFILLRFLKLFLSDTPTQYSKRDPKNLLSWLTIIVIFCSSLKKILISHRKTGKFCVFYAHSSTFPVRLQLDNLKIAKLRSTQRWCCWRLKSSGMWHVAGRVVPWRWRQHKPSKRHQRHSVTFHKTLIIKITSLTPPCPCSSNIILPWRYGFQWSLLFTTLSFEKIYRLH